MFVLFWCLGILIEKAQKRGVEIPAKVLGCNILIRSDLDRVALFFVKQDSAAEKRIGII